MRPAKLWPVLLFFVAPIVAVGQTPGSGSDVSSHTAGVAPIPLYQDHCARCHGQDGRGDGPDGAFLQPPPRDFSQGRFKLKTTIPGTPPTIANVVRTIGHGIPGTAMPAFRDVLSQDEIDALAAYVFTLTGRTPSRRSLKIASVPDLGPNSVVDGKRLYGRLGCADCHGEEGLGDGPAVPRLANDDGSPVEVTDLTRPWTFKGGWERIDIALRILAGLEGTPMKGYYGESLRADQLYSLVDYVLSLRRAPDLQQAAASDAAQEIGFGEGLVARGERLTAILACDRCHTPFDVTGEPMEDLRLAGGTRIDMYPLWRSVASNLTPHRTGLGSMSLEAFKQAMRSGRIADGRRIDPITMPWPHYAALTDHDLEAIHAYLMTLDPIANQIPANEQVTGLDPLVFKARALTGGPTLRMIFHPGNAGNTAGSAPKTAQPADRFWGKVAIFLAIVLVFEILYFWRPVLFTGLRRGRRRRHRTVRERVRGVVLVISILIMAGIVALAWWPPGNFGPTTRTVDLLAPPLPVPIGLTGEQEIMAERGRYLVASAACASCHTSVDPLWPMTRGPALAGGARFVWGVFGEVYATNLTPDPGTGLGEVEHDAFARTLRTGLSGTDRIHPAAMPWPLVSRLTEEEMEAVRLYLQSIPPVVNAVPAPRREGGGALYTVDFLPR